MQVKRTFANVAAGQTDAVLLAGMPGYRFRVLAVSLSAAGTATALTFREKPAGTGVALGPAITCPAAAPAVLPFTEYGWFETATQGNGLAVVTGAGATVGVELVYAVLQEALPTPPAQQVVSKFSVVPSTPTPTVGIGFTVTVTAQTAAGVTVTGYAGTVHLTSSDGSATLGADAGLTGGVGTFAVTLNATGGQTVTATDVSVAATGNCAVTVAAVVPTRRLAFGTQPAAANVGAALAAFTVRLTDAAGTLAANDSTTQVTLAAACPTAVNLGGNVTRTASSGVATFNNITLDNAGPHALLASVPSNPFVAGARSGVFRITQPALADPTAHPSTTCWLDPNDGPTVTKSGSNVTQITDKSGAAHTATGHGTLTLPTNIQNGLAMLLFDGSTAYLSIDALAAAMNGTNTPFEFRLVIKLLTASQQLFGGTWAAFGTGNSQVFFQTYLTPFPWELTRFHDSGGGVNATARAGVADTNCHVLTFRFDGTYATIRVDGATVLRSKDLTMAVNYTYETFTLGALFQPAGSAQFFGRFYLGDFTAASGTLPSYSQSVALDQWAMTKWGLTGPRAPATTQYSTGGGAAITAANALTLVPGDWLQFNGGQTFTGNLHVATPALSEIGQSPVAVTSYGTGAATLSAANSYGILFDNVSNVLAQGLTITGSTLSVTPAAGHWTATSTGDGENNAPVKFLNTAATAGLTLGDGAVLDCTLSNFVRGVLVKNDAGLVGFNRLTVCGNTIHDVLCRAVEVWTYDLNNSSVINAYGQCVRTGATVSDNTIYSIYGDTTGIHDANSGFGLSFQCVANLVTERNGIHDCGWAASSDSVASGGPVGIDLVGCNIGAVRCNEIYNQQGLRGTGGVVEGGGIVLSIGCENCVAEFNYTRGNAGPAMQFGALTNTPINSGNVFRHNVSQNDSASGWSAGGAVFMPPGNIGTNYVYANTIYKTNGGVIVDLTGETGASALVFAGNICIVGGATTFGTFPGTTNTLAGNLYDILTASGAFSLTYNGVTYVSLAAMHAATVAGLERVAGVNHGVQAAAGLVNAGGGVTQMPANPTPNDETAYDVGVGSAAYQAGIDLSAVLSITDQTLDFHGLPNTVGGKWDIGAVKRQV